MAARGARSLSDAELLALLLGDESLAATLLEACGGSLARLAAEPEARASDFVATSDDVVRMFRPQLEGLSHEECWVVYLTSSNRIIERQRVSQGGVTATVVDHRLIIKRALELLATRFILIHNHPSGTPEASPQDKALTDKVVRAAALFDIRLLDHVIIARHHRPRRELFVPGLGTASLIPIT